MLKLTHSSAPKRDTKKSFSINITYRAEEGICHDGASQDLLPDAGKYEIRMRLVSSLQAYTVG